MEHNKRSSFSGKLGYVLSAAGASVGCGSICRAGKYLEISVSGSKVRRRHFPADLYFAGVDVRLYHDCSGNRDWAHDEKEPGRSLFLFRQIEMAVCRRLDQCDHSCACLLYTSDAADDLLCVDLGGRADYKKKK